VTSWLITTAAGENLERLRRIVASHGATLADIPPTPLEEGEQVLEVEGPDDLPERLQTDPAIHKVSPNSQLEY
jgi:hypothetical protein